MGVWARANSACAETALAFAAMNPPIPTPSLARIARGGKPIQGAPLGIIMLETRFPRIPGDIGHAGTWPPRVTADSKRSSHPSRRSGGMPAASASVSLVRASRYAMPAAGRIGAGNKRKLR